MNNFIRPEFLNMAFMRAFISEYLHQNGYSCCNVNFVQARFRKQPEEFANNVGYNLMYEAIGYKLKPGISWQQLIEKRSLYKGDTDSSESNNDYLESLNFIPKGDIYFYRNLYTYFERIKIYFDISAQKFFVRPLNRRYEEKPYRATEHPIKEEENTPTLLERTWYRDNWSSLMYFDELYQTRVYYPDYFELNGTYYYKICHEPYVQSEHRLPEKPTEFIDKLMLCPSKVLSPEEIVETLYTKQDKTEDIDKQKFYPHCLMDAFNLPIPADLATQPAAFYTANVLELTIELKQGIAAMAKATALGFKSIQNTLSDLSEQWIKSYKHLCQQHINEFSLNLGQERREKEAAIKNYLDYCRETLDEPTRLAGMLIDILG